MGKYGIRWILAIFATSDISMECRVRNGACGMAYMEYGVI